MTIPRDQLLLTLIWLRQYPTHEILGWLFEVSDSTATRVITRCLPLLAAHGRASLILPRAERPPGRGRDELLAAVPALLVIVDSFEQRVQRPQTRSEADTWYSGKKKQHTIKRQIAIDEDTGEIIDVGPSVRGPTADITGMNTIRAKVAIARKSPCEVQREGPRDSIQTHFRSRIAAKLGPQGDFRADLKIRLPGGGTGASRDSVSYRARLPSRARAYNPCLGLAPLPLDLRHLRAVLQCHFVPQRLDLPR